MGRKLYRWNRTKFYHKMVWTEWHSLPNSEAAKHLYRFLEQIFNWKILRRVPNKVRQRKFDEAYYVVYLHPTLNNQLELSSLTLFRNGVWQKNVFKLLLVSPGFYRLKCKGSYILIYIYIEILILTYSSVTFDNVNFDLRKRSGFK